MGTYQGPNASVTQEFAVSPGAVAIESLPSVAVGTAYDVYNKESLGDFFGVQKDKIIPWGTSNKVVYDRNIAGLKAYEMYPPKAYANTRYGIIDLGITYDALSEDGITIDRDANYVVPGTQKIAGSCQGIIPYYNATLPTQILASDLSTVIISGGSVVTAQIKPGQKAFVYNGSYQYVGTVGSIGLDETKINLAVPYSNPAGISGTKILVGADSASTPSFPSVLFDPTADFITSKVAVGDILNFSSLALSGSVDAPKKASVTAVINKNTIRFNTNKLPAGSVDLIFNQYEPQSSTPVAIGSTIQLYSYSINRLVGFSQSYGLKSIYSSGVTSTTTSSPAIAEGVTIDAIITSTSFSILKSSLTPFGGATVILNKGDVFAVRTAIVPLNKEERDPDSNKVMNLYTIDTITFVAGITSDTDKYIITTTSPVYISNVTAGTQTAIDAGNFIDAWSPEVETEVVADFRAIRSQEHNVVKRIAGIQDIYAAWVRTDETSIDPRNELAFMMSIMFERSGGKVCYGINVDSSAGNISTEYGNALEELKLFDVYSHCFGTTDPGVNGIIGTYCDDQSAPYEAHERIGIICYDTDDLYLMGTDSISSITNGTIVLSGALNLLTAGVTVNDQVKLYDENGLYIDVATVLETPTLTNAVVTDWTGSTVTPKSAHFESGRKDDQAVRIGSIKYGNRRVTQLFPGWFYAVYDGNRIALPPYFIASAIAGMDSGLLASQPFSNMSFSIPGLSNIELNTGTYFRKAQLDEIGGGGVDIMMQSTSISQTIKSRHDLTTNMDAVQYRERSITKQADVCAKTLRTTVNPYVGRYNIQDANLFRFLGQACSIACSKLIKDAIIFNISVKSIKRDEVIDDKINFYVEATAYIAGNYYDITMLVKTR